ncbi:MAG: cytidylate kinase-like family protein [Desulfobacteraceae bacterium]|nr:cytidylate kinase-like family protein [Desulfobacteraceae bacterium]
MAVITIFGLYASKKRRFGTALSKKLNYDYADRDIIREMARRANISEEYVESYEDGRSRGLMQILSKTVSMSFIKRIIGDSSGYMDSKIYFKLLEEIVISLYKRDNIVIVGRGSHCILQGYDGAYFIKIKCEWEDRVKTASKLLASRISDVEDYILEQDKREKKFMEYFYNVDWLDPSLFSLVINLSKVSREEGIQQVIDLISAKKSLT